MRCVGENCLVLKKEKKCKQQVGADLYSMVCYFMKLHAHITIKHAHMKPYLNFIWKTEQTSVKMLGWVFKSRSQLTTNQLTC